MRANYPKILIGCPTYHGKSYCLKEYVEGLKALTYPNFDVVVEDNSENNDYLEQLKKVAKEWNSTHPNSIFRIVKSTYNLVHPVTGQKFDLPKGDMNWYVKEKICIGRNKLRKIALDENYDYFFSLEQDVVPPTNCIEKFLSRQKDLVSGVYMNPLPRPDGRRDIVGVVAFHIHSEKIDGKDAVIPIPFPTLFPSRLIEVDYAGLGAILMSRKALEKVEFKVEKDNAAFDDFHFGKMAKQAGFQTYLDSSMLCLHLFRPLTQYPK